MKNKALLFVSLLLFLTSCSKQNQFRQFNTLPEDHRWKASDKNVFEFVIDDEAQLYDIKFNFSHVYDYQYSSIPLQVTIESPDGKSEKINTDLMIKDSSGKQLADCSGDVCDLLYKIKEKTKLQKGTYKITFSHSFKGPYLPNVIGIGLTVDSVK